jgi:CheY-like chemotaxis protein
MKKPLPPTPLILLVDDNRDGLLVRRALLEEAGYAVQIAETGEEGLKLFEAGAFDLVVTDYRMPGMNGVELIRRIRTVIANARIVMLSGFVDPLGLNPENTGADAVLSKSANEPALLVRAVKRLLNRIPRKPPSSQKTTKARAAASTR